MGSRSRVRIDRGAPVRWDSPRAQTLTGRRFARVRVRVHLLIRRLQRGAMGSTEDERAAAHALAVARTRSGWSCVDGVSPQL